MEQFKWSLEFCDKMSQKKIEMKYKLFNFSHEFNKIYDRVIPYHKFLMNLVMAGGMKETAHSRLLWKILSHKADGTYPILESFYNKLLGFNLTVKEPKITRETGHIDILVQDREYVLIIENKRHNAHDQPNQLARYISFVRKWHALEKIYICYLSGDGGKEPDENSWKNPEDQQDERPYKYKTEFKERFKAVSFKNEILNWLNDLKIENTDHLQTTLEQYAYLIKQNK
jgi:hypothetical protein